MEQSRKTIEAEEAEIARYKTEIESLKKQLEEKGLVNQSGKPATYEFYVSDAAEKFVNFANTVMPFDISKANIVNIEEY